MKPQFIKSDIKLTIGILVSNRIETIRKCMESIKPLLEAVPSELIAVDTVGEKTDGSIDIVKEYTDKIYRFEWCNDFAAARNVCMDHAKGEWFFYLDDDEWFEDVKELTEFFQNGECEKYHSGYYYVKNYSADGSTSMTVVGRMVRRTANTRFVGKVHETFSDVMEPNKFFSCFVHHYGYAFTDEASKKKHQLRNLSLLKEELKIRGYTPRICAQIVQELLYLDETIDDGGKFCLESIEHLREQGQLADPCSQWVLLASVRFYFTKQEYEKVISQAEEICSRYAVTQMTQLGISWLVVRAIALCEKYPEMGKWIRSYVSCHDWLKQHPEAALSQAQLDMLKYYSERFLMDILRAGVTVANAMGQFEEALEYLKRFPWKEYEAGEAAEWFDGSRYQGDILITLRGLADKSYLVSYYKKFYKDEWFLPENRDYLPKECRECLS